MRLNYFKLCIVVTFFSSYVLPTSVDISSPEALALGLRSTGYYLQHGFGSWNKYPFKHRRFYGFGGSK